MSELIHGTWSTWDDALLAQVQNRTESSLPERATKEIWGCRTRSSDLLNTYLNFIRQTYENLWLNPYFPASLAVKSFISWEKGTEKSYGMVITIRLNDNSNTAVVLLHSLGNYVGVYTQEISRAVSLSGIEHDKWKLICHHDSCWVDGLRQWLSHYSYLGRFPNFTEWWELMEITPEIYGKLRTIRKKAYGEDGNERDESCHWAIR
jgi:hypothetical protein